MGDDDVFLCTYGDALTDVPLDQMIERLDESGKLVYSCQYVRVSATTWSMTTRMGTSARSIQWRRQTCASTVGSSSSDVRSSTTSVTQTTSWTSAPEPAQAGDMITYRYDGFWAPMDTMKDKQDLDALAANGGIPGLFSRPSRQEIRPRAFIPVAGSDRFPPRERAGRPARPASTVSARAQLSARFT